MRPSGELTPKASFLPNPAFANPIPSLAIPSKGVTLIARSMLTNLQSSGSSWNLYGRMCHHVLSLVKA